MQSRVRDLGMQPGPSKRDVQGAKAGEPAKKKKKSRKPFSTFVFMDMETTGLIIKGNNPQITELCLVSVQREELLDGNSKLRVQNKLLLCFNPEKPLSPKASELTAKHVYNDHSRDYIGVALRKGLNSANLGLQCVFSEKTAQLINSFLQYLPQPVCLLAHNGNRFDFPILMAAINEINQSLDPTLFCADTIEAFKTVDVYDQSSHISYKLEDIYYSIFGQPPPESHTAEGDCITLLNITQKSGSGVLQWVRQSCGAVFNLRTGILR